MRIRETKQTPVWEAVAELEKRHYTREEIFEILFDVAADINPDT